MSRPQGPHQVDRDLPEFQQDLRVAQTGGQIFFAFLFSIAFAPGFKALTDSERTLYLVTLVVVAASSVVLIAPVAVHQWNFGKGMRREWLVATHLLACLGLVLLALGLVLALVIVTDVVAPGGWWVPAVLVGVVLIMWIGYRCCCDSHVSDSCLRVIGSAAASPRSPLRASDAAGRPTARRRR